MIPQIHPTIGDAEASAVSDYIKSGGWLTENHRTRLFEQKICEFLNISYCAAVPNGTIGLILSLMACGIGRGDKVAVPALTMIATANAVRFVGATPVFYDVDENGCLDFLQIKEKTDAIIYVSLNGRCGDMDALREFCDKNYIVLIEDACQSLGSEYGLKKIGTVGDVGVFSLSPQKIITTGQGGLIVTNKDFISNEVKKLKDFGRNSSGTDFHPFFGINAKYTDVQATIGIEQLKTIQYRMEKKKVIYGWYQEKLGKFMKPLHVGCVPWFVDIYTPFRDLLFSQLEKHEIKTRKMYPVIPHQPCYGQHGSYPVSKMMSERGLWLPSSIDLSYYDVDLICKRILKIL